MQITANAQKKIILRTTAIWQQHMLDGFQMRKHKCRARDRERERSLLHAWRAYPGDRPIHSDGPRESMGINTTETIEYLTHTHTRKCHMCVPLCTRSRYLCYLCNGIVTRTQHRERKKNRSTLPAPYGQKSLCRHILIITHTHNSLSFHPFYVCDQHRTTLPNTPTTTA